MMTYRSFSSAMMREARLVRMTPVGPNSPTQHPENIPHAAESADRHTKPLTSPHEVPDAMNRAKSQTEDQLKPLQQAKIAALEAEQKTLLEMIENAKDNQLDTTNLTALLTSLQETTQGDDIEDMASTVKSIMKMAYHVQDVAEEFCSSLTPEEVKTMESITPKFTNIVADAQAYNLLADLSIRIGFPTVADVPDTPEGQKLRTLLQAFTPKESALLRRYFTTMFTGLSDDLTEMGLENPYAALGGRGRENNPRTASYLTAMRRTDETNDPKERAGKERTHAIAVWNTAGSPDEKEEAKAMMLKGGVDVVSIEKYVTSWNDAPTGSPDRTINEGMLMIYGVDVQASKLEQEEIHFFTDDERFMRLIGGAFLVGFGYLAKFGSMIDTEKNTSKDSLEHTQNSQADTPEARGEKITRLTKSVQDTQKKIGDLKKSIKAMEEDPKTTGGIENPVLTQAKAQLKELEELLKRMNETLIALNAAAGTKKADEKTV